MYSEVPKIPELRLSTSEDTHPETRAYDAYRETRTFDSTELTRHQVHMATKQILALRTQLADQQRRLEDYEKECAYLHSQMLSDAARISADAERIKMITEFDYCRKCNATCKRYPNTCRSCINAVQKERRTKIKEEKAIAPKAIQCDVSRVIPDEPRIIESQWDRSIVPMKQKEQDVSRESSIPEVCLPEKSASGRRRAKRYTHMDF